LKTVLLVTRHFPPDFTVGGKRAWRFARYLPQFGWQAHVLTTQPPAGRPHDDTPLELPEGTSIRRTYYPSWWPDEPPRASDGTVATPTRYARARDSVVARIKRATRLPAGRDLLLRPRMSRHIANVARQVGADALWVTSSPYTATLFGVDAARQTGLPLVLDLRDPWTLNFLSQDNPGWQMRTEQAWERAVFQAAERVVVTCEEASAAYRRHMADLPDERVVTIYNAFDPDHRPQPVARDDGRFQIVHFGSCYGHRRLQSVLEALAVLRDERGMDVSCVRLLNLGRMAAEDLELSERLGLDAIVEHMPFVPYRDGLAKLAASDLLLLLAYGTQTLFIPAKLYDYLLVQRPILCVSSPSELTGIIDTTQTGAWAQPGDIQAIGDLLERALKTWQAGGKGIKPDTAEVDRFSAPATTREFASLLDDVVAQHGSR